MTTYQVQDPQGQVHEFEGPAGATPDQVLAIARAQFGRSGSAPLPPAPTPAEAAFAAGRQTGNDESGLTAGTSQAAQQGTFGLQNYVNAGARYVAQRLAGVPNADTFGTDLAYSRGKSEGEAEGHPIASTVGGTAGTFLGGAGAAKLLKVVPGGAAVSRFLSPTKGAAVANVAKAAAVSGAAGGAQALDEGAPLPDAERTAAISAVAGPVTGKIATFGLNKLQPSSARAMQTLADTIGETPATLQNAYNTFQQLTGRVPSMAELAGLKSQGKLRSLAAANAEVGDAAITAANMGSAPLHEQLQAAQNATYPQTLSGIHELRDAETDAAMNTPHPVTGVKLRDTTVSDPNGVLADPHVAYALQPNTAINSRVGQPSPILDRIQNNTATIGDVDTIRKSLRDVQNSLSRPAPGSNSARDPILAREFGDIANKVEGLGVKADPDYGLVLHNYREHSRYAEGFMHGLKGNPMDDIPAGDSQLSGALKTQTGVAGYEHGNALYTAQQTLNSIAPGTVRPQDSGINAGHVAQAAMAAGSSGTVGAIYHAMRAIPGLHLPDNVQQIIAKQLFNPKTAQQGINNLQRAGVDSASLRAMAGMVGLAGGVNTGAHLSNNGR